MADRKARVKALWSLKPQASAISATDCWESRSMRDAAAIRDLVMNWFGVKPNKRLIKRARRCEGKLERRASQAGVIWGERLCSNSASASAKPLGIS